MLWNLTRKLSKKFEVIKRWNDTQPTLQKFCQGEKVLHNSVHLSISKFERLGGDSDSDGVCCFEGQNSHGPSAMSRTSGVEEETPNLRDQRTIFVGNLPIEIASKKVSRLSFPSPYFLHTQTLYKPAFVETTTTAYSYFCAHCKNRISTVSFYTI